MSKKKEPASATVPDIVIDQGPVIPGGDLPVMPAPVDLTKPHPSNQEKYDAFMAEEEASRNALLDAARNGTAIPNDTLWNDQLGSVLPQLGETIANQMNVQAQTILQEQGHREEVQEESSPESESDVDIGDIEQEVLAKEKAFAAQNNEALVAHYQQIAYQNHLLQQRVQAAEKQIQEADMAKQIENERYFEQGLANAIEAGDEYAKVRFQRALDGLEMDKKINALMRAQQSAGNDRVASGQPAPFYNPIPAGYPIPGQPNFQNVPHVMPNLNPNMHQPNPGIFINHTHPLQPYQPQIQQPAPYVHPLAAIPQQGLPSRATSSGAGAPSSGSPGSRVHAPNDVKLSPLEELSIRQGQYFGVDNDDYEAKKKIYIAANNLRGS